MQRTGKLIVFYGINNLGKTTQAKMLVDRLKYEGIDAEYLKYALYDLAPSGNLLNQYLREENSYGLSAREFQLLQVLNRTQYQPLLQEKLQRGTRIIAEDYVGTGIAWGLGAGIDKDFLYQINSHLIKSDFDFFFDGERFLSGIEKNHQHEQNDLLMQEVRKYHQKLALEFSWTPVDANQKKEEIQSYLQHIIAVHFLKK